MVSNPFEDLIEALPELFGIFGSKRKELERRAENEGFDNDHVNGVDDDFVTWNLPEDK